VPVVGTRGTYTKEQDMKAVVWHDTGKISVDEVPDLAIQIRLMRSCGLRPAAVAPQTSRQGRAEP
jgi:hypothetical protein